VIVLNAIIEDMNSKIFKNFNNNVLSNLKSTNRLIFTCILNVWKTNSNIKPLQTR